MDDAWEYGEADERGWKEGFEEKEFNDLDVDDGSILTFIITTTHVVIIDGFNDDVRGGDKDPRPVSTLSLRGETLAEQVRNLDAVPHGTTVSAQSPLD